MSQRHALLLVTAFFVRSVASLGCTSKFGQLLNKSGFLAGGTDNSGNPVTTAAAATAMSFNLCLETCGHGIWDVDFGENRALRFSDRFSTWLLPFLALVSQLPFGGDTPFENAMSILLNVGSPTLAAYSVTLTTLNSRWVHRRFSRISYPNAQSAARVLDSLQQSSLEVTMDDYILSSLIVLPENDQYWAELLIFLELNHPYTWSFSSISSIIWVAVAFLSTVIQTFGDAAGGGLYSNGLGVGFAWLWLLAIVTCCLKAAPRCDTTILRTAIERANRKLFLARYMDLPESPDFIVNPPVISLDAQGRGPLTSDERRTAPIYNYARMVPWSLSVERMYTAFGAASYREAHNIPVNAAIAWEGDRPPESAGGSRSLQASLMALLLTFGTLGAAILVDWYTPTKGLSCHSGGYLIYALNSILVWAMLVTASHLTHSIVSSAGKTHHRRLPCSANAVIVLRRVAKVLACINALWIIVVCVFQFAGVYDNCWCRSGVFSLGPRAYVVIFLTAKESATWWRPLIGFTVLACASVGGFVAFNIALNPSALRQFGV